jgi:hypothetical protein
MCAGYLARQSVTLLHSRETDQQVRFEIPDHEEASHGARIGKPAAASDSTGTRVAEKADNSAS